MSLTALRKIKKTGKTEKTETQKNKKTETQKGREKQQTHQIMLNKSSYDASLWMSNNSFDNFDMTESQKTERQKERINKETERYNKLTKSCGTNPLTILACE